MGLINLRNALMAGKRLPYDAEVEYLESTGTQYVDTGVKPGPNTRVEITFAMTTFTANCGLFGARGNATADNNSYNLFIISNNGSRVRWDWSGSGQYQTSEAETSTDATYVLGAAGGNITRNGTTVMSVSASKAAINYPIYVFNFNNVGTPYSTGANARFWSVKIYDGQTLVFDAIPVRKKTVGYLYDRVSGQLFGNAGTGDFVVGPDVVPVEYIESHGTEYIDTGVGYFADFDIDVVCPKDTTNCTLSGGSGYSLERYSSTNQVWRLNVGTGVTAIASDSYVYDRHNVSLRSGVFAVDGVEKSTISNRQWGGNATLVFRRSGGALYSLTLYSLKLWDSSNVLVRSFIPVRIGSGSTWEGALIDTLTRRIYRNAGTGAFTYGNDLKYPIPA